MPKTASEKCRLCSKLEISLVLLKHGPQGTGCFEGKPCHKRRTYYRNRDRYNQKKRKQYWQMTGKELQTLQVPLLV